MLEDTLDFGPLFFTDMFVSPKMRLYPTTTVTYRLLDAWIDFSRQRPNEKTMTLSRKIVNYSRINQLHAN